MRVVILDHTGALGGAELALVRLLGALDPEIETRTILMSAGPLVDELRSHGHIVDVVPAGSWTGATRHELGGSRLSAAFSALAVLPYSFRLARTLRRMKPDLLCTASLKADLIGVVSARLAGVPLVWHVHDRIADDYLPKPLVGAVRRLARWIPAAVVANSLATAATLPGARNLAVVAPGFAPEQVRHGQREPGDDGHPVVGLIGRISPTKGQMEFVRAAAIVRQAHPGATFRIVGEVAFAEAEYEAAVRAKVEELGLTDAVRFTGRVDTPDAELDAMALCVHASPVPEPFGQVIVEAMIRRVPVIATRAGGATEILEPVTGEEPLGRLVEPGDHEDLARAIIDLLDDPVGAAARAERAWESATVRFPIERSARQVTAVWSSVARAGADRSARRFRWARRR